MPRGLGRGNADAGKCGTFGADRHDRTIFYGKRRRIQSKIEQGGVVKKLLQKGKTPDQIIENLYLRCLSRRPTEQEVAKLKEFFAPGAKPEQVLNDIFLSLLNAKEFVFNH